MSGRGGGPLARTGIESQRDTAPAQLEMPLTGHLAELRTRLIIILLAFVGAAVVGWYGQAWMVRLFHDNVGRLVYFTPAEMFFTKLRMAVTLGSFLALPVVVAQAWLFVMPGLYPAEQALLRRVVPGACALFAAGLAFGYAVVYPAILRFLLGMAGDGMQPAVSIAQHFTLFVGTILPFGILFQVPLVMPLLARLGLIDPLVLQRRRRHIVFWSFVIAAMITPPDVVSQVILAVPMLLCFELGMILARRATREKEV